MKVTGLSWTAFCLPLTAPFHTAGGPVTSREGLVVRLLTDAGITGLGEASPHPTLGRPGFHEVMAAIPGIATSVLGADPASIGRRLPQDIPPALACAISTASLDAASRSRGIPLAQLLTDRPRSEVPVNATIAADQEADASAQATAAREAWYSCVKLKVGMTQDIEAERRRVAAVRRALGPSVKLRLDANGAWTVADAIHSIRCLAGQALEYVEQPVAPGNLAGMARVRHDTGVPIATDEDVADPESARQVLHAGAADVLVIKPMVAGDLRSAVKIATIAAEAGASSVVTTTIDAGIGTAAALHLAATLPEGSPACGLATSSLLAADIIAGPLEVHRGLLVLPRGPGLGVELNERALARYATASGEATL